ncbi:TRAP transporter substrate-binding protein DctP [Desulfobotulus mexicanus]|nr:TRAP transporter substrate-binding protein DctP [Desulfobotulus mexicanus]
MQKNNVQFLLSLFKKILSLMVLVAFGFILLTLPASGERSLPLMRISVENSPSHVQTKAVRRFAEDLSHKVQGRLHVKFYDSARLYRDAQVLSALASDRLEMAVPGTWHFDRYEPDVGIFLLPAFYGRSAEDMHRVVDGEIGRRVEEKIEKGLRVFVPGRWLDLGHAHLYTNQPVTSKGDLKNLNIRVAGGLANAMRVEALGAKAVMIPWPDLPARLKQGNIDGVLTTHETFRSAKLWNSGLSYVFEDRQYFPQYIPVIRQNFWRRLPEDLQKIIMETWEEHVDEARKEAAEAQKNARKLLLQHGMKIFTPTEKMLSEYRSFLAAHQDEIATALGVNPELYADTMTFLKE